MLAALLCSGAISANAENPEIDGSSYFLPKTALKFVLLTEKTTYTPGEFNQYAERYFKKEASANEQTSYRIISIKMIPYGVADTSKVFTAKIDAKHNITYLHKNANGVLLAINDKPAAPKVEQPFEAAPKPAPINSYDYLSQEILHTGSKAKMAELTADEIYDIRESRSQLAKGQADNMPTDGQQLKLMLNRLDIQEKALNQLFYGTEVKDTAETVITYIPEGEVNRELLFRFSKHFGTVDKDDLSGTPYYISISDAHQVPTNTVTAAKEDKNRGEAGVWVNLPGKIKVNLYQEEKTLSTFETNSAQFGRTEPVTNELFSKKSETKLVLNPITGNLESISTELKK